MRILRRRGVVALGLAGLLVGTAACGGGDGDNEPSAGESPAGEPTGQAGGTYAAEITEPTYLAPTTNCYESECSAVLDMINDPELAGKVTVERYGNELGLDLDTEIATAFGAR